MAEPAVSIPVRSVVQVASQVLDVEAAGFETAVRVRTAAVADDAAKTEARVTGVPVRVEYPELCASDNHAYSHDPLIIAASRNR